MPLLRRARAGLNDLDAAENLLDDLMSESEVILDWDSGRAQQRHANKDCLRRLQRGFADVRSSSRELQHVRL